MATPRKGDHLSSPRSIYSHHGIYIGYDKVIHYTGYANSASGGPIEETSLTRFHDGNGFEIIKHPLRMYSPEESVERAKSRVGENAYSVFGNNCEHFVEWCIEGKHNSKQVDRATAIGGAGSTGGAAVAAKAIISSSGAVAGLSGSGVMSGLASVGSVIGGGAVAGVGVLGGASGLASALLINTTVLADDESLDSDERTSRTAGRIASVSGAAAGTAGSIVAIGAMGTTAGFSAAGITSGLAAIGGTVGGGMAAGAAMTIAAPVAIAVAAGYGIYKIVKWFK